MCILDSSSGPSIPDRKIGGGGKSFVVSPRYWNECGLEFGQSAREQNASPTVGKRIIQSVKMFQPPPEPHEDVTEGSFQKLLANLEEEVEHIRTKDTTNDGEVLSLRPIKIISPRMKDTTTILE